MKKNLNEKLYRKIKSAVIRGINEAMDDPKLNEGWKEAALGLTMGASLLGGGGAKAQSTDYEYDNKPRQEQVSDYSDYQLDSIGRSYIRDFYKHSDKMEKRFEHEISAIDSNAQYKSWIMTNALVRDDNNQIFELTDDFDAMSAKERAATLRRLFDLRGDRDYRNYCLVDAPNRKNVVYIIYIPDMIKVATRFDI